MPRKNLSSAEILVRKAERDAGKALAEIRERRTAFSTLADPEDWLVDIFAGGKSASGKRINQRTALTFTAVYAAIKVISDAIAQLPLRVLSVDSEGNSSPATEHPLYNILRKRPNPECTPYEFYFSIAQDLLVNGNFFAFVERNAGARIINLWRLRPEFLSIERQGRKLIYRYTESVGPSLPFDRDEIIHLRNGVSWDGIVGLSPIDLHRNTIGLGLSAEEYAAKLYNSGAQPSGVLQTEGKLKPEEAKALLVKWNQQHGGSGNAHKVALLQNGLKFTPTSFSPHDSDFIAQRQFQIIEVARIFKVPPHMLMDLERATFSNIEEQALSFVSNTIQPWVTLIEQGLERDLLKDSEKPVMDFSFNMDALLRADSQTRFASYKTGQDIGLYSLNEIRALEGRNSLGPEGDVRYRTVQLVPLAGDSGASPQDDPEEPEDATQTTEERAVLPAPKVTMFRHELSKAQRPVFESVAKSVLDVELSAVRSILSQASDVGAVLTKLQGMYEGNHRTFVKDTIRGAVQEYAKEVAQAALSEIDSEAESEFNFEVFANEYSEKAAIRWCQASLRQLRNLAKDNPEDPRAGIFARLENWEEQRPERFALRESVQANAAVSREVYKSLGVAAIRWHNIGEVAQSLDQKVSSIGGMFANKGDQFGSITVNTKIHHPPLAEGDESIIFPVTGGVI